MSVPGQITLPGMATVLRPTPRDFTLSDIRSLKDEGEAIEFSVSRSGYNTKDIPLLFGIEQGQWSCIKKGTKFFPHDRRNEFMDFVGNEALLMYGCESRGYDFSTLQKHHSDLELQLEQANARIRDLEYRDQVKDELMQKLIGGRK